MPVDLSVVAGLSFVASEHSSHSVAQFVAGTYYWEQLVAKLVVGLALMATLLYLKHPRLAELFEMESRKDLQQHQLVLAQYPQ